MRSVFALTLLAACGHSGAKPPQDVHSDTGAPARLVAFVSGYSPSILSFEPDPATGALAPIGTTQASQADPSFLAFAPDHTHIYAVSESTNRVAAYALDQSTAALRYINDVSSGGTGPAHVGVDRT